MKKTPPLLDNTPPVSRRCWYFAIWGAGILALLLRLIAAWEISRSGFAPAIFSPSKATDLRTYMDLAESVATGSFKGVFYYQPFYYSVFLVLCRWISGASVWGVVIIQSLLGAFTAMIAGLSARFLAGRIAGIVCAYLTALCTVLIFYTPFHQIATLQTFNLAVTAYFAIRAAQSCKYRYLAGFAIAAAVADLTRGNIILIFVPLTLALLWIYCKRRGAKAMLLALLMIPACFLAVESPFIIHNSRLLGRLCGPSTAADAVLALGNTPEAPPGGRDPGLPAGPMEYPQAYHVWMQDCAENPVWKKIVAYIYEEPAAYLELTFRKLLLFWDHREIPNNVSLAGEGTASLVLQYTVPAGILLALGIAGMLLMLKKLRKAPFQMLYITVIFFWGATAAFYNLSRFRAPLLPELAVFAGVFVAEMIARSRRNDWKFIRIYGFLTLAAGVFFTLGAYDFYRYKLEKNILKTVRPQGTCLQLGNDRQVQFYHGPMTFGSWTPEEAPQGTEFAVTFPQIKNHVPQKNAEVEIAVQGCLAGVLVMDVSGSTVSTQFDRVLFKQIKIRLPENFQGNTVKIKVLYNSAQAVFIADKQRNYASSTRNGKIMSGELVVRLTRTESVQKNSR